LEAGAFLESTKVPTNLAVEFFSLAVNRHSKLVYYSSYSKGAIGIIDFNAPINNLTSNYTRGFSVAIDDISVDFITGNVYFVDTNLHKLLVANSNLSKHLSILDIRGRMPSKLAVDPFTRKIYWSEVFDEHTDIRSCSFDGNDEKLLMSLQNVRSIGGFSLDFHEKRLYWTENRLKDDEVSSGFRWMSLDTEKVSDLHKIESEELYGIVSLKNEIVVLDAKGQFILVFNKANMKPDPIQYMITVGKIFSTIPTSLIAFSSYSQPLNGSEANPCVNHNCSVLCIPTSDKTYTCKCDFGLKLLEDGVTCGSDLVYEDFILVVDAVHEKVLQAPLNTNSSGNALNINVGNTEAIAYDIESRRIYWSNTRKELIQSCYLNGSEIINVIKGVKASHLAIDQTSRNLYFVDQKSTSIEVISLDNIYASRGKILMFENSVSIRSLLVSSNTSKVYWTDIGLKDLRTDYSSTIESMNLDGTNRTVLLQTEVIGHSLYLNEQEQRLYWIGSNSHRLNFIDLQTGQTDFYQLLPPFYWINHLANISIDEFLFRGIYTFDGGINMFFNDDCVFFNTLSSNNLYKIPMERVRQNKTFDSGFDLTSGPEVLHSMTSAIVVHRKVDVTSGHLSSQSLFMIQDVYRTNRMLRKSRKLFANLSSKS